MHMVHALNLGIELGLFREFAHCTPPVKVEKYIESVSCSSEFTPTWIHVMQFAGVIEVDQEQVITPLTRTYLKINLNAPLSTA